MDKRNRGNATSRVDQLRERLAYWQKVLRLQDWDIQIEIARMPQFTSPDRAAEIHIHYTHKRAFIRILDPEDYSYNMVPWDPQDMEMSLVHELMHIYFYPAQDHMTYHELEQAVHSLATAFVGMERGK